MKTIEITTTQKVTISYELATLQDRIIAAITDLVVMGAMRIGLFTLSLIFSWDGNFFQTSYIIQIWTPIFLFLTYHFCSELFMNGQSLGKKLVGIKVVKINGQTPEITDYLIRAFFYFIDLIMTASVLGNLMILSTDKRQRLGDIAANTVVIKTKINHKFILRDILNIGAIEGYEPQYPMVKQFSEQDMLLIKNVLDRHRNHNNAAHREILDEVSQQMIEKLGILQVPEDKVDFLKTLIKDYILLTR